MTKNSAIILIFFCFLMALISSCNKEEKTPAYFSVNSMSVTSDYIHQGTASHNIRDAWVYVDGNVLGVYELPARFPVLQEGKHSISIAAGIYENGISATRLKYPFYNFYDTVIDFVPGQTVAMPATIPIQYYSGQEFTWYEDFEGTGSSFAAIPSSEALLVIENTDVFEGAHCGKFTLTTDDPSFNGEMDETFTIVTQRETFLELNYKAEQPFAVGVVVETFSDTKRVYVVTVNKLDSWNKIYINLSKVVNENQSSGGKFGVYIYSELADGRSQSIVYIDNLKLLHN